MAQQLKTFLGGGKKTTFLLDNKGQECWTNRFNTPPHTHTYTHTAVHIPGHRGVEGTKETNWWKWVPSTHQDACESFLQLPRIRHGQFQGHVVAPEIGVLLHAPRVPHVSSPSNFSPPTFSLPYSSTSGRKEFKKRRGDLHDVRKVCVWGGGPSLSFVFPLHLQIYSLVTSSRTREGGGVIKRWVRAASRPPMRHFQGTTGDGTRRSEPNPSFPSLLSVSCTISAPLPVGRNDAVHDSRLLQSAATVWEFSSLIPPLLLTS